MALREALSRVSETEDMSNYIDIAMIASLLTL